MLTFYFSGAGGRMTQPEVLTTGMVGKQVKLEFSSDWDDLIKTVVFSDGEVIRDAVCADGLAVIPAEVLTVPLRQFTLGVYGVSVDGELVIPTIRALGPKILPGVDPSGDEGTDPSLPIWAQIRALIGDLEDLDTEAAENLVAAINELVPFKSDVQAALSAADSAQTAAAAAQVTADSAQEVANTAQTTANHAQAAATTAQTSADNAQAAADTAQVTADNAQTAADNALEAAAAAQTAADNAQAAADTAQSTADAAKTAAATAQTTANTAQTTASSASSKADMAQFTANSAQSAASSAVSKANVANNAATQAQTLANSAQKAADEALTLAGQKLDAKGITTETIVATKEDGSTVTLTVLVSA